MDEFHKYNVKYLKSAVCDSFLKAQKHEKLIYGNTS